MNLLYIKRLLETVPIKAVSRFPAVLASSYRYISLELPDIRDGEPHHVQAGQPGVVMPCG